MAQTTIREYVEHVCRRHKRTGTIQPTLEVLRDKLRSEVGDFDPSQHLTMAQCLDPVFMQERGKQLAAAGDLAYLEGFLETQAATMLDCKCRK